MAYYRQCTRLIKQLHLNHKRKLFRSITHSLSTTIRYRKHKPISSRLSLKYPIINHQFRIFSTSQPSTPSTTPTPPKPPKQKPTEMTDHDEVGHAEIDYSTIYKERTGVTSGLWRLRLNLTQKKPIDPNNPPIRAPLEEREPWQSSIVVLYDFLDNASIKNEYIRFDGGVRFGRILEDMDSLAGNVAETHGDNEDGYPISFVTASVDRIDLKRRFPLNKNLVMQGTPIYVGKSSINVQIEMFDKKDENFTICTANFIMVARDGITGKATTINTLKLGDELAQQNFIRGRFDAQLKQEERAKRLRHLKPAAEESELIHQIWLGMNYRKDAGIHIDMMDKDKYISMGKTVYQHLTICQPQQLNRSGKIFGGYLMRTAYELARVTAYRFIGGLENIYDPNANKASIIDQHPQFVSSDEITFEYPVSVGCIIRYESVMACTDTINALHQEERKGEHFDGRKAMMIFVRTYIQEPGKVEEVLSNVFSFCYVVPKPTRPLRRVIPLTYEENMIYINGKRALDQTTKIAIRDGSTFAQYL